VSAAGGGTEEPAGAAAPWKGGTGGTRGTGAADGPGGGPLRAVSLEGRGPDELSELLYREWLVTNGLGGYAAGTVCGTPTRRYHGILIAALPAPFGRTMMLNELSEQVTGPDGLTWQLGAAEISERRGARGGIASGTGHLREFRVENGLPVWRYGLDGTEIEKRVIVPQRQNTVYVVYTLVSGPEPVRLELFPALHFRAADAPVSSAPPAETYTVSMAGDRYEITAGAFPALRLAIGGRNGGFTIDQRRTGEHLYRIEESRGYEARGSLWTPGYFHFELSRAHPASLAASTDRWERITAMSPAEALAAETERRRLLLDLAGRPGQTDAIAELVYAADQFLITPAGRIQDSARARAAGYEVRTVIAGYHWFTDWGRDTMISLEGLTLATGRHGEAGSILRTFAYYERDGLIPNLFPEGQTQGLYHTADASLWFFHAAHRYVRRTGDRATLRQILPVLMDIADRHLEGTRFGIAVDRRDGLLRQGEPGYQLTWMDAKVEDWVVTPRRGKAVEINALWYNALRLLEGWLRDDGDSRAEGYGQHARRAYESFNERFWHPEGGHLLDVVDGETGDDPSLRPNQIFAIALDHPVLRRDRWAPVLEVVQRKLLTPVGLRTLSPDHPDYKPRYFGDLRARDAAYHQGTVWPWLIGPWIDAWLRVHPEDREGARRFLHGLVERLDDNCFGTLCEIHDAEAPYQARGCVAQAWSVAEVLRAWLRTEEPGGGASRQRAAAPRRRRNVAAQG